MAGDIATHQKVCSIDGCEKSTYAFGLCPKHYTRKRRHGDPLAGNDYGPAQAFLKSYVNHTGDECLIWPFVRDRNGYGLVWFGDHQTTANFVMCTMAHGERPTPSHESAHSCGRGHEGCVHPKHLRWATRAENHADKIQHDTHLRGERSVRAKLTEYQVHEIRRAEASQSKLGKRFGVKPATISAIQRRKIWTWLPDEVVA